jgi:uncharacterized protein affecting Mg2+/Co2+ transport
MTLRNLILLLFAIMLFAGCFDMTRHKKYSMTEFFTSYDSSSNSRGKQGKRFKYAYEEYNGDSNMIYQEIYANTDYFGNMWGKLMQKANLYYKGKLKMQATIEVKTAYLMSQGGGDIGSYRYTYEYKGNNLSKLLYANKPVEEYQYDPNNNQTEIKFINKSNTPQYDRFIYHNSVKISAQYFVADTIVGRDTLIYDKNNRHIETISGSKNGQTTDTLITRNNEGRIIEKKWKYYFQPYSDYPFYDVNKYFYDNTGKLVKIEYYSDKKLKTVYEFEYN